MLKQLKFDNKYMLAIATIAVLYVCYQLAIKKTIEAWELHQNLTHQIAQSGDLTYNPAYLARKSRNLDQILHLYKVDTTDLRSDILTIISSIAERENVKLAGVPTQDPDFRTSNFLVQKLDFEGDYFSLLKMLRDLQQAKQVGIIRSITIKTVGVNSLGDKQKKIAMMVYFEQSAR